MHVVSLVYLSEDRLQCSRTMMLSGWKESIVRIPEIILQTVSFDIFIVTCWRPAFPVVLHNQKVQYRTTASLR